jgi:DNA-binding LacI/PurR family transcriptional regulator
LAPVTIKVLADKLGVTPSTVSRALAGSSRVSEETRLKVIQLAEELNYIPNLWAQNLVSTSSNLIGCLVLELSNPFYVPVFRAIQVRAQQENYFVFLGESQRQLEIEKSVIDSFRRIRAAGVIVTPVLAELDHLKVLEEQGIPVVVVGRSTRGFFSVNVNNRMSGALVGQYLVKLDHRRIGFVYSGEKFNIPEQDRLAGLAKVMAESGLGLPEAYPVGKNDLKSGELAAEKWLSQRGRPTAVFCSNDMLAMGFISHLAAAGVAVPGEVSVVGHDDVPFAELFKVGLTTVAYPKDEVGRRAIEILLSRINHTEDYPEPVSIVLKPSLVIRQSCQALRK